MKRSHYADTHRIRDAFQLDGICYTSIMELMTRCNGLALMTDLILKPDPGRRISKSALPILNQILYRTINFHKPLEFIRVKGDLLEGDPRRCLAAVPFCEKTVINTLSELSSFGMLIKIRVPQSRTSAKMYGFDLPKCLLVLHYDWENTIGDQTNEETRRASISTGIRGQDLLVLLNDYLEAFIPMFDVLVRRQSAPLEDVKGFCNSLDKVGPSPQDRQRLSEDLEKGVRACRIRRKNVISAKCERQRIVQEIE